jgi:hypothetical protein
MTLRHIFLTCVIALAVTSVAHASTCCNTDNSEIASAAAMNMCSCDSSSGSCSPNSCTCNSFAGSMSAPDSCCDCTNGSCQAVQTQCNSNCPTMPSIDLTNNQCYIGSAVDHMCCINAGTCGSQAPIQYPWSNNGCLAPSYIKLNPDTNTWQPCTKSGHFYTSCMNRCEQYCPIFWQYVKLGTDICTYSWKCLQDGWAKYSAFESSAYSTNLGEGVQLFEVTPSAVRSLAASYRFLTRSQQPPTPGMSWPLVAMSAYQCLSISTLRLVA